MTVCKLSTLLGAKRWSQRELCRRTGLFPVTISRLFHDEWQEVSRDVIDRVCRALGVEPGGLLRWQPQDERPPKNSKVIVKHRAEGVMAENRRSLEVDCAMFIGLSNWRNIKSVEQK